MASPEQIFDTLQYGMRLFHDGMRDAAMVPLASVLRSPHDVPGWRLAAAGLLGEAYRGRADFPRAEHYYRIALAEADDVAVSERASNAWYLHYRPRCALGLITVLRRLLSIDHATIARELRTTRDLARQVSVADLAWQLAAVDGLYRRQCGDLDGAAELLGEACEGLKQLEDFCFLYPEHVEALLLQVQLLIPRGRVQVRRQARALLDNPAGGSWSKAVAAACCLHLQLDQLLAATPSPAQRAAAADDSTAQLLDSLDAHARREGDPFLISEALILQLAWSLATGHDSSAARTADRLLEAAPHAPPILTVLRACEVRVLTAQLPAGATGSTLRAVVQRGSEALRFVHASVHSYGHDGDAVAAWAALLDGTSSHAPPWLDGPHRALRYLAWP